MNTKILVALVIGIALFGLTGAASAQTSTDTSTSSIYYEFVKTIEGNGISVVRDSLDGIESTAGWQQGAGERALIQNTLVNVHANAGNIDPNGVYHATLTQAGTASITKRPLDSEDDFGELEISMMKGQDLIVSGQFKSIGAVFNDHASVGVNYYDPITNGYDEPGALSVSDCGNCHATEESKASGVVRAIGAAKISEAAIGTTAWTSLSADGWTGTVVMDGGSSAYSSFFGDSIVGQTPIGAGQPAGGSIITSSDSWASHSWNSAGGEFP
jgi:hypothetical protein